MGSTPRRRWSPTRGAPQRRRLAALRPGHLGKHPPPGHTPFRGESVVQVCVGGQQQRCKGKVRCISRIGDVGWVQPGERGNSPDEPACPDIDPGHAAQLARLRQVDLPQESWKRAGRCAHWIQDSSPSDGRLPPRFVGRRPGGFRGALQSVPQTQSIPSVLCQQDRKVHLRSSKSTPTRAGKCLAGLQNQLCPYLPQAVLSHPA